MNYFDPLRPRLGNDMPMLIDSEGNGVSALQRLAVTPVELKGDGLEWVDVSLWLKGPDGGFAEFTRMFLVEDLQDLLTEWRADPEAVLRTRFDYTPPARSVLRTEVPDNAPAIQHTEASTEDLGL